MREFLEDKICLFLIHCNGSPYIIDTSGMSSSVEGKDFEVRGFFLRRKVPVLLLFNSKKSLKSKTFVLFGKFETSVFYIYFSEGRRNQEGKVQ